MIPRTLQLMINGFESSNFSMTTEDNDGRVNSITDGKGLSEFIAQWANIIEGITVYGFDTYRKFSTITLRDDETGRIYPINVKFDSFSQPSNVFSKGSYAFSLTNANPDSIKGNLTWSNLSDLLNEYPEVWDRDVWFFVVNKETGKAYVRGLKQLTTIKSNPSTTVQVDWSKEFENEPSERDGVSAKNYILDVIRESLTKKTNDVNYFLDETETL